MTDIQDVKARLPMGKVIDNSVVDYDYSIVDMFSQGWQKVSGYKSTFWGAAAIYFLCAIVLAAISGVLTHFLSNIASLGVSEKNLLGAFFRSISQLILYPLVISIMILGIKRSIDLPVKSEMIFDYYHYFLRLVGALIAIYIVTFIPISLGMFSIMVAQHLDSVVLRILLWLLGLGFFAAGVYLLYAYMFTGMLIAEKNRGIWSALETSRRAVSMHWFKLFFLMVLSMLVLIVSIIPLFIGLIWAGPWVNCTWGVVYRTIFGVEDVRIAN